MQCWWNSMYLLVTQPQDWNTELLLNHQVPVCRSHHPATLPQCFALTKKQTIENMHQSYSLMHCYSKCYLPEGMCTVLCCFLSVIFLFKKNNKVRFYLSSRWVHFFIVSALTINFSGKLGCQLARRKNNAVISIFKDSRRISLQLLNKQAGHFDFIGIKNSHLQCKWKQPKKMICMNTL